MNHKTFSTRERIPTVDRTISKTYLPADRRAGRPFVVGWALAFLGCISLASLLAAEDKPDMSIAQYNLNAANLALEGYDPVAYQTSGRALKGWPGIEARQSGVIYRFATETNRDLFTKDPARYAPAYGGWCATAMVRGEKVDIDPKNFKVTDGRLFLFFKAFYADARKEWVKDEPANIAKADAHWKNILTKP